MKNFRFLVLVYLVAVSMTFVGCRHANKLSQFGDDIAKFGDDAAKYGDDVIRAGEKLFDDDEKKVKINNSSKKSRNSIKRSNSSGNDNTYDYYEPEETYYYEPQPVSVPCSMCGGQGFIVDVYSGYAYDCAFCDYGWVQSYQ